jgi:peptidyl-prolyl cis-trans isomerase D
MFDLFRSRAKAVRYLLGALLVLVALSMVITLIPGFGSPAQADDPIVAEVGGEPLTVREVQANIQAALRGRTIPPDMVATYVPQYINQMIAERALAYQAGRMGFQVTETDLAQAIQSVFPQMFQDGKFVGREAYQSVLAQQNMTIAEFEANMRKQMLLTRLRNIALEGVLATPDEIEAEYRRKNEQVEIEYVSFAPDKLRAQIQVSPEEIAARFKRDAAGYRIPEKRSFQVVIVDEARVAAALELPEADLRRAYEASKDRYRTPERVKIRHILLKTTDKSKTEIESIRKRTEDLLKQIRGGADFAELAKKNSEDPGSAVNGGDLDWVARGQTVKNFEETAFSLQPKQLSGVVGTEYGFHILQLLDKQEARLKPFAEVKGELAGEAKRQAVLEKVQTSADQIHDQLVKSPRQAAEIARRFEAQLVTVDKAGSGDPIPEIGLNQPFMEAVGALRQGEVTPIVPLQDNKLVVAALTDIIPARPAELAEVEKQIRQTLTDEKALEMAREKGQEAGRKLSGVAGDLKKLAQSTGGEFKTAPAFGRDGAAEGIGGAQFLAEAFVKPAGSVIGPIQVSGSFFVVKVTGKTEADMSKLPAERESMLLQIKRRKATERKDLFEDGIVDALIREGKVKIHDNAIRRLVAAYRQT